MRDAFFRALGVAARKNPHIYFVTGDLGFGVIDELVATCPAQVINAGVAEQAMTGLAAGLALTGAKVFTYSIANFPTLRCLEQVRNDVALHGADVTIVAVGGGLAYGPLGSSHHATEDLAIMRTIPGMAVAAPGDPVETERVMETLLDQGGPAYLRLGRAGEPVVHDVCPSLPPGASVLVRDGEDVCLLSTGGILPVVVEAADHLSLAGVTTRVVSLPWLAPIDHTQIRRSALECRHVVTVEEHSIVGGLGSCVAELLAEMPAHAPLLRIALPQRLTVTVGSQDYLREVHNLSSGRIASRVLAQVDGHLASLHRVNGHVCPKPVTDESRHEPPRVKGEDQAPQGPFVPS